MPDLPSRYRLSQEPASFLILHRSLNAVPITGYINSLAYTMLALAQ
jgi:hypothetical protein